VAFSLVESKKEEGTNATSTHFWLFEAACHLSIHDVCYGWRLL
jgi:hypothetical protein